MSDAATFTSLHHYEIFKNALLYSLTFRLVGKMSDHAEGDYLALALCAFFASAILKTAQLRIAALSAHANSLVRPIGEMGVSRCAALPRNHWRAATCFFVDDTCTDRRA
jgi:hypothetical protein